MATCSIDGCAGKAAGRGWCGKHYARWMAHGDPLFLLTRDREVAPPDCSVDECDRASTARGLCNKHYSRWRKTGDATATTRLYDHGETCTFEGCDRPYSTMGYCTLHYGRFQRHGDPAVATRKVKAPPRLCSVTGCGRRHAARGYCAMHDKRLRIHGSLDKHERARTTGVPCSVADCPAISISRNLCQKHYKRWRTHGDPMVNRRGRVSLRAGLDWRDLNDVAKITWGAIGSGYRGAVWREHPSASPSGRLSEHTAVMSAVLGRPIRTGETVHHKNGVRHDNRPENLELWLNAHRAGQRVTDLIADAHDLLERYKADLQLWPEHLRP